MSRSLPQEILDHIIDHLHNEPRALKTCCLISKSWVYQAQKCLFYHVQFRRHHHVSRWRRSFPDPLNSPAHHTQTLSIGLTELVTVVDVDTLRAFRGISRLDVDTTRWRGPPFSLLPLHGFFPAIGSLCLSFSSFQSSKIFPFICSFPLLENLALAGRIGNNRDVVWNVPQTSPNLTGSLDLSVGAGIEHLVRQLLDLPNGLRPKSIAVRWSVPEAVGSTMDLVFGCSDTLESLKITNHLEYLPRKSLDLSKAKKLKNIEFLCREPDVTWITAALRTMELDNLQSISLVLFPHSDLGASVSALSSQGWVALDQLLVQLCSSSSSSSSSSTSPGPSQKQQNNDHNLSPPQTNKKRTKKTPPPLPNLPHELIIEILSRLPAKSLIKFRCVSKSFKSLISNPQFIKTHLERVKNLSRNGPDFSPEIVISSSEPLFKLKSCSLYSVYNNPVTDAVVLDYYLLRDIYRYDWVVGSCDGLLCLGIKQDFVVLWNPSTRVFNRLPGLGFAKKLGSYTVFGFGYDSQIDDYKVLAMFCFLTKSVYGGSRYVTRIKVCALKGECWRRLEDFGLGLPYDVSGKHVDGKLCWPVMPEGSIGSAWSIVAFDLAQEMFEEVVQPDYGAVDYERVLGVLQGWLCVMCNYQGVRADVWVLKEFGVRDSWTKLFSIPYLDPLWFHYSVPLCIDVGGEVLLEYKSVLVIYNPKHGTFRYPVMNGASSCIEADVYIQSLVSPVVDGQV